MSSAAYTPDPHGFDLPDAPATREQPAAWTRGFQRYGWWLPLRFVLMVPLIPVVSLGNVAQVLLDWLDEALQ